MKVLTWFIDVLIHRKCEIGLQDEEFNQKKHTFNQSRNTYPGATGCVL